MPDEDSSPVRTVDDFIAEADARYAEEREPKRPHPPPRPDFWIYKVYDSENRVLYVGQTKTNFRRLAEHRYGQDWSRQIAWIEIEHCPTQEKANRREVELIRMLNPPFNTLHTGPARSFTDLARGYGVHDEQKVGDE